MLNQLDELDDLILRALLRGQVPIPDKLLDLIFDRDPEHRILQGYSTAMVKRLQDFATEKQAIGNKLEHPDLLNHFGEYLATFLSAHGLSCKEVARIVGMDEGQLYALEKGRLSPTEIGIAEMASLIKRVNLKYESAKLLLYNSYKLSVTKPKVVQALARYNTKKKSAADRLSSILSAANELALKLDMPEANEQEIQTYLGELQRACEKNEGC